MLRRRVGQHGAVRAVVEVVIRAAEDDHQVIPAALAQLMGIAFRNYETVARRDIHWLFPGNLPAPGGILLHFSPEKRAATGDNGVILIPFGMKMAAHLFWNCRDVQPVSGIP